MSTMRYGAVFFSVTAKELSPSTNNFSVVFGTPPCAHTVCRYVAGLVMPEVAGFFTSIGPAAKLL